MRQKLTKLFIAVATVATTLLASCQQESDEILGNINGLDYRNHKNMTYTEMWDVLWNGYNQNYVGWETETIDWDEVNATIRPQMVALDAKYDTLSKQGKLDDTYGKEISSEASKLFHSAFDSLHDGHTYILYIDRCTKNPTDIYPGGKRVVQRKDYNKDLEKITFEKDYYIENREVERFEEFSTISLAYDSLYSVMKRMNQELGNYTESERPEDLVYCQKCIEELLRGTIDAAKFDELIFKSGAFNDIIQEYGLFRTSFRDNAEIQMYFTKDSIAYFRMSSFMWPKNTIIERVDDESTRIKINSKFVQNVEKWHDKVYEMHNKGTLKGVILDVRNNGGGANEVLKYFPGSLFKGSQYQLGTKKMKNGIGRLDYTVPQPMYMSCYGDNTEDITEPIVILTNCNSVSCSEFSTAAVKQHKNGISMGTTTFGGGASLYDTPKLYSWLGYAGVIGTMDDLYAKKISVYAYIPFMVTYYDGGIGNIEGKGITPDIEVPFDLDKYESDKLDTQFERAIDYIRTGK